jgi:GNAT superfamily N-acetyltransferase
MENEEQIMVYELIKALYQEDPEGKPMTDEKISRTFQQLHHHPDYGRVLVFEREGQLVGYALLINFWSNEYGGIVLSIDELYILPDFRGRGIGTDFIRYLQDNRINNCVALELEVLPYNAKALKLYQKLGFNGTDRAHLLLNVGDSQNSH